MSVIKNKLKKKFLTLPNEVVEDPNLTHGAFRVYCYLASKPDGWTVRNTDIQNRLNIKQNQTLANYLKELEDAGWLTRERCKNKAGKLTGGYDYHIMENPYYGKTLNREKPINGKNHTLSNTELTSNTNGNSKTKKEKVYSNEIHGCFSKCLEYFSEDLIPDTDAKKEKWLDVIEKLNRIDKVPFTQIVTIVKSIRKDSFWRKNFLSLVKLRKTNGDGVKYFVVFCKHLNIEIDKDDDGLVAFVA